MRFEDGLRMLASLVAQEHKTLLQVELVALERSERYNIEPELLELPTEAELAEHGQVVVITEAADTGAEGRE